MTLITKHSREALLAAYTPPSIEQLKSTLLDLPAAMEALPEEEKSKYRQCQQSIVDAQRSANRHEGLLWIT